MNPSQLQNHFDAFYEDFWCEMCKFGEVEEVVVCDNNNDREFPGSCASWFEVGVRLTHMYVRFWQISSETYTLGSNTKTRRRRLATR